MGEIKCPFCKQYVDETLTECPYCCSTFIMKKKTNIAILIGIGMSVLWITFNVAILFLLQKYPNFLKDYTPFLSDYLQICLIPMAYTFVTYIISIVKNAQRILGILGIIMNIVLGYCFFSYAKYLFDLYK